jgi:hypothetical protein
VAAGGRRKHLAWKFLLETVWSSSISRQAGAANTFLKGSLVCEVRVRGRWLPCTFYEALTERAELMRCKDCHGLVQALKETSLGARAHIEHLQRHPWCRLPVGGFSGVESEHPLALK